MKTRINIQKILFLLCMMFIGINASKAMEINTSGFGKISGTIQHAAENKPLEFITVTVYSAVDSSMVAGTISNHDGSFYISMLNAGSYYLEIGDSEYEKLRIQNVKISASTPKVDVGRINLKQGSEGRRPTAGIFHF